MGQEFGKLDAGLSVPGKPEGRGQQVALLLVEMDLELTGMRLAVVPAQLGLRVEQIHLARAAVLEQADDRLRAGLDGLSRHTRMEWFPILNQKIGQCEPAQCADMATEKRATVEVEVVLGLRQGSGLLQIEES